MGRRLLAVLGAVAIVIAAMAARSALEDDTGGRSDDRVGDDNGLIVVCATDLAEMCPDIDGARVLVEDAADTAARIVSGAATAAGVDAWVTTSAWTEVIASRAPGLLDEALPLATSPVVLATDRNRTQAVAALCDTKALWRCVGDNAGAEWGTLPAGDPRWGALKTGLPDADSAIGLAVLASVASGFFDATDFATNDFEPSGLPNWLGRLAAPSGTGEPDPVGTLVTARGKYSGVGDIRAAVDARPVDVLEPAPAVVVTAVLVHIANGEDLPSDDPIRDALLASGWEPADRNSTPRPTLKPGVMAALHTLWTEITR